jgi:hypothetical protein
MNEQLSNPFDFVKASDFSDEQIARYWVDVAGESGLENLFQPRLVTPMLLSGGKGSGKTHLMRFFSSSVRKLRHNGNLKTAVMTDKYLAIYVQADGMNAGRFDDKGIVEAEWAAIFSFYCEIWLSTQFLKAAREIRMGESANNWDEIAFLASAKEMFNSTPPDLSSLDALIMHLTNLRKSIDHVVSNMATGRRRLSEIDVCISPGELVFGLPRAFREASSDMADILFVYMIDEIENFTSTQQRFLNSLIRYRKEPVTFKIGARLYGLRTRETLGGPAESIRIGAEYTQVELDEWLRENATAYSDLARKMIIKRLEAAGLWREKTIGPKDVGKFFEEVDKSDFYKQATVAMVKKYDDKGELRPYFEDLNKHILQSANGSDRNNASAIIERLRIPDAPLLEKVNVYLIYRDWRDARGLLAVSEGIKEAAREYIEGRKTKQSKAYKESYDHFQADLLAQLTHDCKVQRITYAGLDTLIHLSQGFPRNLLGILKQIYRRSLFAGEQPFQDGKKIGIATQNEGVRDAAAWFWDDAQPDSHGPEARSAVQSLAELFSAVRFSPKPAECSVGSFTVAPNAGTQRAREVLKYSQNWSYLIHIKGVGSDRNNSSAVDEKYQLSPMLAPRWEVSETRRGAIQLNEDLFNAIFDPDHRMRLEELKKNRLANMEQPWRTSDAGNQQQQDVLFS